METFFSSAFRSFRHQLGNTTYHQKQNGDDGNELKHPVHDFPNPGVEKSIGDGINQMGSHHVFSDDNLAAGIITNDQSAYRTGREGQSAHGPPQSHRDAADRNLSLIHISEPTRRTPISYA